MKNDVFASHEGDPDCWDEVVGVLNRHIEQQGMRRTQERYEVLRSAYRFEGHFTAEQLFDSMKGRFRVTRATIYASLALFEQLGLIVRHCFGMAISWERTYGVRNHIHQVCTRCGRVQEVALPRLETTLNGVRWPRFRVATLTLCAYGLCATCQSQITRRHNSVARKKATEVEDEPTPVRRKRKRTSDEAEQAPQ